MNNITRKPILFNDAMVCAIIDGRKTQTRRAVKGVESWHQDANTVEILDIGDDGIAAMPMDAFGRMLGGAIRCPYGNIGDRLWVREAWHVMRKFNDIPPREIPHTATVEYQADDYHGLNGKCRPSIHMPRWASRILLKITVVRVERLQDISTHDCWAEGIPASPDVNPIHEYCYLWDSIYGAGSWDSNPWVWVIEFQRIEQ